MQFVVRPLELCQPFDQILEGFATLKAEDFDCRRRDSDGLERLGTQTPG
jgi:hypothetical protein